MPNANSNRLTRILFVCTFQGARSLIAKGYADRLGSDRVESFCSGFEEGWLSARMKDLIREDSLSVKVEELVNVFDRHQRHEQFDYVISLCQSASNEQCSVFQACLNTLYASTAIRKDWSIPDFTPIEGDDEQWLLEARKIRETIKSKVESLIAQLDLEPSFSESAAA